MIIDREKAIKVFTQYVDNYDSKNEKIKLKIEHTYRVCELCEKIAITVGLNPNDVDIAWLTGLLHDIGRFEQVRMYGTFNDSKSVNHAKLGSEILFDEMKIRDFIEDSTEDKLIKFVIENHNAYKLPEGIPERYIIFSNILRDADKVDILKVNMIVSPEEIYNVSKEEVYSSEVTKEVLDNFKRKDTILRTIKKTAVDNIVGHISLIFGLVYDESKSIVKKQGYLNKMLQFKSDNDITNRQFDEIREIVAEYVNNL